MKHSLCSLTIIKKIILSLKLYLTHIHPTLKKTFHTLSASNYYVSFMLSSALCRAGEILPEPLSTKNIYKSTVSKMKLEIIMKCLAFDVSSVI